MDAHVLQVSAKFYQGALMDKQLINTYRTAIEDNADLFKDKIVLDVGCGTGIFSIIAASAGAARVFAVEWTPIATFARQIVAKNNFDHIVIVLEQKVEELKLPDDIASVDIIISQWMGYCLYYSKILDAVLYARDKFLIDGGLIFPDYARLYMVGIYDRAYRCDSIEWWNNVYHFDMRAFRPLALQAAQIDDVSPQSVATQPYLISEIDMYTIGLNDMNINTQFQLKANRKLMLHSFLLYFNIYFRKCNEPKKYSTAPRDTEVAHWKQTIFSLDKPLPVYPDQFVNGQFAMIRNNDCLKFIIDVDFENGVYKCKQSNPYHLG